MAFFPPWFTGARKFCRFTGSAVSCTHLVVSKSNSACTCFYLVNMVLGWLYTFPFGSKNGKFSRWWAICCFLLEGVSWPSQVLVKTLLMSRSWVGLEVGGFNKWKMMCFFVGSFRMMGSDFSLPDDFKNRVEIGRIGCFLFVPLIADWILLWTAMNWKTCEFLAAGWA